MPKVSDIESQTTTEVPPGGSWIWSKMPAEIRARELVAKGDALTQIGQFDKRNKPLLRGAKYLAWFT